MELSWNETDATVVPMRYCASSGGKRIVRTIATFMLGISRRIRECLLFRAAALALIAAASIVFVSAQGQGGQPLVEGLNNGTLASGDSFSAYFLEYSGWERHADVWTFEVDAAATLVVKMDTGNVFTGCLILYRGNTPALGSLISRESEYGGTEMTVGLEAGVYSLEATGASYGASGAYTLLVEGLIPPERSAHDVKQLTFGTSYGSITDGDSISEAPQIQGNRADFWWFRVPGRGTPNLRLEADFPSVVNLYEGAEPDWGHHLVAFDDCLGFGNLDLETWLDVGTYCLEVSTCGRDPRGTYSLTYPAYQDESGAIQGPGFGGLDFGDGPEPPTNDSLAQIQDDSWGVSAILHELGGQPDVAIQDIVVDDGLIYATYRLSGDSGWALGLWDLYTGERLGCAALRAPGTLVVLGDWTYVFPVDWRNPSNTQIVRFSDTLEDEEYLELFSRDGLACTVRIGSTNYLLAQVSRGSGVSFERTFGYVLLDVHGEQRAWCGLLSVDVAGPVRKMQGYRDGVMFLYGDAGSDRLSEWRVDLSDDLLSFSPLRIHELPAEILATGPIVDFVWDRHRDGVFLAVDDRANAHTYGVFWCASSNRISEFSNWHWIAREVRSNQEEMLSNLCLEISAEGWIFVAAEFATPMIPRNSYGESESEGGTVILGDPRHTEIVVMTHQTCPEEWAASEPMYLATRPEGGSWGCSPLIDLDSTDLCLVCSQGKYWADMEDVGDFTYLMFQEDLEGRIRSIRRGTTRGYYSYHWISPYQEPGIYLFHGSIGFHTIPTRIVHLIEGALDFPAIAIDAVHGNP